MPPLTPEQEADLQRIERFNTDPEFARFEQAQTGTQSLSQIASLLPSVSKFAEMIVGDAKGIFTREITDSISKELNEKIEELRALINTNESEIEIALAEKVLDLQEFIRTTREQLESSQEAADKQQAAAIERVDKGLATVETTLQRLSEELDERSREIAITAINLLEGFEGEERLDASAIKNIPIYTPTPEGEKDLILRIDQEDWLPVEYIKGLTERIEVVARPLMQPVVTHVGGTTELGRLVDIELSNLSNNDVLKFDTSKGKWVNGIGGSGSGTVESVSGDGSIAVDDTDTANPIVSLVNDSDAPGTLRYYGTDASGTKGFFSFPAAGAVSWGDIAGTLSSQSDLQTALDAKADVADLAAVATSGSYSDLSDTPSIPTQYTDEMAQDAVGSILTDSAEIDFTYSDATPSITASLKAGSIDESKLDTSVNASLDLADSSVQPADLGTAAAQDVGYFATAAQGALADTAVQGLSDLSITATATELNVLDGITASTAELNYVDGVTSAIQTQLNAKQAQLNGTGFVKVSGTTVSYDNATYLTTASAASSYQPLATVLTNTTASFTTAKDTKLSGIETGADVTDATNVDAAGAVMNTDTSTASMSFVIDEDDMASNSDTKVPTQQSVKAYVDSQAGGGTGITWNEVTGTTQSAAVNNGYITNNASQVRVTLPAGSVGDVVRVAGKGSGGWKVDATPVSSAWAIHFGTSTAGASGGSLESTNQYDSIELVCISATGNVWSVISSIGNITVNPGI